MANPYFDKIAWLYPIIGFLRIKNKFYKNTLEYIKANFSKDINLIYSSENIAELTLNGVIIGVAENFGGKIDIILERITNFYGREISNMVANLMALMEPLIMVIMGVAVGMMVAAIILPMYNMASQF